MSEKDTAKKSDDDAIKKAAARSRLAHAPGSHAYNEKGNNDEDTTGVGARSVQGNQHLENRNPDVKGGTEDGPSPRKSKKGSLAMAEGSPPRQSGRFGQEHQIPSLDEDRRIDNNTSPDALDKRHAARKRAPQQLTSKGNSKAKHEASKTSEKGGLEMAEGSPRQTKRPQFRPRDELQQGAPSESSRMDSSAPDTVPGVEFFEGIAAEDSSSRPVDESSVFDHSVVPEPQEATIPNNMFDIKVEATAVDEDEEQQRQQQFNQEPKKPEGVFAEATALEERPKWKKYLIVAVPVVVVLGLAGALVAILLPGYSQTSKDNENADQIKVPIPTGSPTISPFDSIREFALSLSSVESLQDPKSPQSKAVDWLVEDEQTNEMGWSGYELVQRYVLAVLYLSTGGDNWSSGTTWFLSPSVCGWGSRNLKCNGSGLVQNINLFNSTLQGTIPAELGALTALTSLILGSNELESSIPSEIGRLTALEVLYLGDNQLTSSIPLELGQLTGLTYLDLYLNQLTARIPAELGQLTMLTALYLDFNQLSDTIPSQLGQLTELVSMSLYGNEMNGSIPSELGQLTALTWLDLRVNELTSNLPSELGRLTALTTLSLSENQLSGNVPSELGELTELTYLYRQRTYCRETSPSSQLD